MLKEDHMARKEGGKPPGDICKKSGPQSYSQGLEFNLNKRGGRLIPR